MLYLVTNRNLAVRDFEEVIKEALLGGVDRVILREKDLSDEELLPLAKRLKVLTENAGADLIINHSLSVAKEVEAYAYHTSFQNFVTMGKRYPKVGVSIHSVKEGMEAQKRGADYILAGHIFETDCKRDLPPRGLNFIKELTENLTIPVVAIGGIHPSNATCVYESGAQGVAVMSYLMSSACPSRRAREFKEG